MKAPGLALLARVPRSRKASLLMFAVASGALLFAAIWFTHARHDLDQAYSRVSDRQQSLAAANALLQEAQLKVRLATTAHALVNQAHGSGFVDDAWGERLINVAQAPLPRQDVNDLLASVTRSDDRLFGAEAFELSVTRPQEGLFDPPGARSPPLTLTLRGTLLFRTQAVSAPTLQPAGDASLAHTAEAP